MFDGKAGSRLVTRSLVSGLLQMFATPTVLPNSYRSQITFELRGVKPACRRSVPPERKVRLLSHLQGSHSQIICWPFRQTRHPCLAQDIGGNNVTRSRVPCA